MFAVTDVNCLWRLRPFAALAQSMQVVGLQPMDPLAAFRHGWSFGAESAAAKSCLVSLPVLMPFGWARRSDSSCRHLLRVASRSAGKRGVPITGIVVTSPHYGAMPDACRGVVPVYYYCSDDYSSYAGWGGKGMMAAERDLVRQVRHSFYVSRVLAERAVREYGVPQDKVSVSPNATDEAFLVPLEAAETSRLLALHPRLRRPVVGVIGGINDRLDFELLLRAVRLPEVGSLLMVGGVDKGLADVTWRELLKHPKCVVVGSKPHEELPMWLQMLDLALIPYRNTPLNRACSPMRLFDHLASGRPIVATKWCAQVQEFAPLVKVGASVSEVASLLVEALRSPVSEAMRNEQKRIARENTWRQRAANLMAVFSTA